MLLLQHPWPQLKCKGRGVQQQYNALGEQDECAHPEAVNGLTQSGTDFTGFIVSVQVYNSLFSKNRQTHWKSYFTAFS